MMYIIHHIMMFFDVTSWCVVQFDVHHDVTSWWCILSHHNTSSHITSHHFTWWWCFLMLHHDVHHEHIMIKFKWKLSQKKFNMEKEKWTHVSISRNKKFESTHGDFVFTHSFTLPVVSPLVVIHVILHPNGIFNEECHYVKVFLHSAPTTLDVVTMFSTIFTHEVSNKTHKRNQL